MSNEQARLEAEMSSLGIERYRKKQSRAEDKGLETTTPVGRHLLKESVGVLAEALRDWTKLAADRPGRRHQAVEYIELLPLDMVAALSCRTILDCISHSKKFTRTAMQIASVLEDEVRYRTLADEDPGLWSELYKRTREYQGSATKRRHIVHAMNKVGHSFMAWPREAKLKVGVVCLDLFMNSTGLIKIQNRTTIFGKTITEVTATEKTVAWLEKSHARSEILTPMYLPNVVEPVPWTSVNSGGFHSDILYKRTLVKTADKEYIKELDHHDLTDVYTAVNMLQSTGYKINSAVLDVFLHYWENAIDVEGLPLRENEPIPPKPEDIESNPEARKVWRRAAAAIHDRNARTLSERLMVTKVAHLAQKFQDKVIYFTQQMDWRGRLYPNAYHLHPQGPDFVKALLLFSKGKPIAREDVYWLKVHGANCWGMSGDTNTHRVKFITNTEQMIMNIAQDPYGHRDWEEADSPWSFLAFCFEYAAWKRDPTNFISCIGIAVDASQSGIQIMSLLLRDRKGGLATNCIESDYPKDLYGTVADKTNDILRGKAKDGCQISQMWLDFGVDRGCLKRPVMTRVYNATRWSSHQYVRDWCEEKAKKNMGGLPVTDSYACTMFLTDVIWQAMDSVIEGTKKCMDWMKEVAEICVANDCTIRWMTPIGFPVKQAYFKWDRQLIKTKIGDTIRQHSLRIATADLDRRRMANGLAPNLVHSLDGAAMMKTVLLCKEQGIESFTNVHDSFSTVCADSWKLHTAIREAYAWIFKEDYLKEFREMVLTQLPEGTKLPPLPEYGDMDPACVLDSMYFFN